MTALVGSGMEAHLPVRASVRATVRASLGDGLRRRGPRGSTPATGAGDHQLPPRPRHRRAFLFATAVCALTWAVFAALHLAGYRESADMASLADIIDTSTVSLAAVVGVLLVMRWHLTDNRGDLSLGLGLFALGALTIGFDDLVVPRLPDTLHDAAAVGAVAPVGFVLALALCAAPVLRPGRRPAAVMAAGAVALLLGAWLVPDVAHVLAGRRERAVPTTAEVVGQLAIAAALVALAVAYWRSARGRRRTIHAWVALMLLALAQSRTMLAFTFPAGTLWLAGSRILRMEALLFAVMGANRELHEGITTQQSALRRTSARLHSIEVQREAEQAALEERRHDVRSALFAIGGVAELLGRRHDDLDAGTMDALTQALGAEVDRLQTLVAEQEREELRPFALHDAVEAVVLLEQSNGLDLTCHVSRHLSALGRPKETAQVLRNLLDNARLYAPGSPVVVRAERRDDWVVVVVEDEGPGVPPAERKTVFERSRRGTTSAGTDGSGLGLYVGRRLMREQGGDLWVTDAPGGGAAFVLSLPVPPD